MPTPYKGKQLNVPPPKIFVIGRKEIKSRGDKMTQKDKFKELYNDGMYALVNEKFDKSIEMLTQAAELQPDNRLVFTSRGAAYLRLNRNEEALNDLNRAIEIDANYPKAHHLRGLVNENMGNDEAALRDFDHAIELDPEYGAAYNSRANLHSKMGNEDLAMEDVMVIQHLTNAQLETFANENNIWRSNHMRVEQMMGTELDR
jgi:tetratricopeptide (TPR) repeat protein